MEGTSNKKLKTIGVEEMVIDKVFITLLLEGVSQHLAAKALSPLIPTSLAEGDITLMAEVKKSREKL
jgi:hypothetical protein